MACATCDEDGTWYPVYMMFVEHTVAVSECNLMMLVCCVGTSDSKWTGTGSGTWVIWSWWNQTESGTRYTPALDCCLLTFWHWKCHIHISSVRWRKYSTLASSNIDFFFVADVKCGLCEIKKNNRANATHGSSPVQEMYRDRTKPKQCWTGEVQDQDQDLY